MGIFIRLAEYLESVLEAENERWILWFPVAVGVGVGGYFSLREEPAFWLGPLGILVAAVVAFSCRARLLPFLAAMAFLAAALGFSAAQIRTMRVAAPVVRQVYGPVVVSGRVISRERLRSATRVTLERLQIPGLAPRDTPQRVRIRLLSYGKTTRSGARERRQGALAPGDWIDVLAVLRPPPAPVAPGAFDFQRRAYFQGLGAVGYALGAVRVYPPRDVFDRLRLSAAIERLRGTISDRVMAVMGPEKGAMAAALMTGERGRIPPDVLSAMRDSGLAHLLAISGLHVGLVAGLLFAAVRMVLVLIPSLSLHYDIKKWAVFPALGGAAFYAVLSGGAVPTQRALVMISLVFLAIVLDRRALSLRTIALAGVVILLFEPESLIGASFQMSFAAVVGLIAFYETANERLRKKAPWAWGRGESGAVGMLKRLVGVFIAIAATTLIAGLVTAPLAAFHFNRISVYGLAANLVAVPLTAFWVMPWAIMAFIFMPFGMARLALTPMGWGIGAIIAVARGVSSWPGAVHLVPTPPMGALILGVFGGLWLILWRRRWRGGGIFPIIAAFALVMLSRPPDVLVDGSARLVGIRGGDGHFYVSTLRARRYERQAWLRRAALTAGEVRRWRPGTTRKKLKERSPIACDALGCVYVREGWRISVAEDPMALDQDCRNADVVISPRYALRECPAALVIDRDRLRENGAYALWISSKGVVVASVNAMRGHRPWVLRPVDAGH